MWKVPGSQTYLRNANVWEFRMWKSMFTSRCSVWSDAWQGYGKLLLAILAVVCRIVVNCILKQMYLPSNLWYKSTKSQDLNVSRLLLGCLCPIHWSQVLSRERRCSLSSVDRRCSNYIWVTSKFIAYWGAPCIRGLTVYCISNITYIK